MDKVRCDIIGMGGIGKYHAGYLLEGKVQRCELVAVCSTSPQKLGSYGAKGLKIFEGGVKLIRSREVDAVIVATPHYQYTPLGISALEAGVHLMVERLTQLSCRTSLTPYSTALRWSRRAKRGYTRSNWPM